MVLGAKRVIAIQQAMIDGLKTQLRHEQERVNRLTEALALRSGTPLLMPTASESTSVVAPSLKTQLEPSLGGWFDNKRPTPEVKVVVPPAPAGKGDSKNVNVRQQEAKRT